jgi:hypothetical protein
VQKNRPLPYDRFAEIRQQTENTPTRRLQTIQTSRYYFGRMNTDDDRPEEETSKSRWARGREVRPLTTDERASFLIVSLYMFIFCISAFVYWDQQVLQILGVTVGSGGLFLFVAAFFNTEGRHHKDNTSIHPIRSYLISFFLVLTVLFVLRYVGGLIENYIAAIVFLYGGLVVSLIFFRKAMVQVITAMLAVIFLFVTFHNWNDIMDGRITFKDAVRQCRNMVFEIGPIQDVANMMIAGSYVNYLSQVDYKDPQLNIFATRLVKHCDDDPVKKTRTILNFVSNNIHYVSDPEDGLEYAKDPLSTLISSGGDCEDQTLLLCSLLETVGVRTYIAFTDDHVFALVPLPNRSAEIQSIPFGYIDGEPCYALDPSERNAVIGTASVGPGRIRRVFDVRKKTLVTLSPLNRG